MPRGMFGRKRRIASQDLHNFNCLRNILMIIRIRRIIWAGSVTFMSSVRQWEETACVICA